MDSREVFGVGFDEFNLTLKTDAQEMIKVSEILSDTVKYIDVFKKSQGGKLNEINPSDPRF